VQILGVWGRRLQSIYKPLDRGMMLLQLCCWKFSHKKNIAADFFDRSLVLLAKTAKSRFVPPFGGLRGNVHSSSMARWKACG